MRFVTVGRVSDFSEDTCHAVQAEGRELVLVVKLGEVFVLDALCPHAYGYLDEGFVDGYEVQCPLHVGRFDLRTGEATQYPAEEPVTKYPVRLIDNEIQVGFLP